MRAWADPPSPIAPSCLSFYFKKIQIETQIKKNIFLPKQDIKLALYLNTPHSLKFVWNAAGSWHHSGTCSYGELYPQEDSRGRGSCLEITAAAGLKGCLGKNEEAKVTPQPSSYVPLPDPNPQCGRDWYKRKEWRRPDFPWILVSVGKHRVKLR